MDQQDEIQRDPEVLPPETGEDVTTPVLADEVLPDTLVLLPLPGRPFFPGQVQPVAFNPENWQATLDAIAQQGSDLLGLAFVDESDPSRAMHPPWRRPEPIGSTAGRRASPPWARSEHRSPSDTR